jgi:Protein of unknown function (DUF1553)/Protein of unknown function (DUF1549)/Concanavalin A-like lectin/glucanases superfamily/Planctomycete cytochrome C
MTSAPTTLSSALVIGAGLLVAAVPGRAEDKSAIRFNEHIRPILSDKCFKCHGPDAKNQKSDFRVDTAAKATADLGGYAGIVPGNPARSELMLRIHSKDPDDVMPPPNSPLQLTEKEKTLLKDWIAAGAPYEAHWSLNPPPASIPVPAAGGDWAINSIDRFIAEKIIATGLKPAAAAPKEKWLRRVTFDLTGLPPTPDEIAVFLAGSNPKGREKVVDRLLATKAYAERMTSEWLDVARYSDSYGYQKDEERFAWPWRDWVISSFAENMRYDRFMTLQLAGDLLPGAGPREILPTAFNRLHGHNMEGGIVLEEYRVEYVADRINTFSTAFLGLTMECARCHDHKYDPLPTRDYYSLGAFFANIEESGLISYFTEAAPTPTMPFSTPEADAALAKIRTTRDQAEKRLTDLRAAPDTTTAFNAWLQTKPALTWPGLVAHLDFEELKEGKIRNLANPAKPATTVGDNRLAEGRLGRGIEFAGDDATYIPEVGVYERHDSFSVSAWIRPQQHAERENVFSRSAGADDAASCGYEFLLINGRPTASLIHFWPGDGLRVQSPEPLPVGEWSHVTVTYDGSSRAKGLRLYVNGRSVKTEVIADHLTRTISQWRRIADNKKDAFRMHFVIGERYRDRGFVQGRMDELHVFDRVLAPAEVAQLHDGKHLAALLAKPAKTLTPGERVQLFDYFLATAFAPARQLADELRTARVEWNRTFDALPAISIMRETPRPTPTHVLLRGAYDAHGEQVRPDTPTALPPFPADQPRNRLGLARWLTAPDHPLTARVAVNRYWQLMFGRGLVLTPEDFGSQGSNPSHPALLDWLARDFINSGWNLHHLLKQIALSATYAQDTVVDPATRLKDPENLTYSRSAPRRLTGEMVRDASLAASGLLVKKVGGPPTRPYELSAGFEPATPDTGEGVYRRSLYTLWKRNSPAPVMATFGVPKRDVCSVKRTTSSSPLQALVVLNGPQFIEAARVLASQLLTKHGPDAAVWIDDAFVRLVSRKPDAGERELLVKLHQQHRAMFRATPEDAAALIANGQTPPPPAADPVELASATLIVNALMNLSEALAF